MVQEQFDSMISSFLAIYGDISKEKVNAIVNAANEDLHYGSGVSTYMYVSDRTAQPLLQLIKRNANIQRFAIFASILILFQTRYQNH